MITEKKYCNLCLLLLVLTYIILSVCGCKVHKSIQKDSSKYDSSVFANNEHKHISNSEEVSNIKKKNDYSKITIELSDSAELPAFLPSNFTTTENKVTLPKGTRIVIETGTQKEISNTNKKVFIDSSQKENSKVEIKKSEMNSNKQVDKTMPAKWKVILFCIVLIGGGVAYHFRKPIFSHIKGWITGV